MLSKAKTDRLTQKFYRELHGRTDSDFDVDQACDIHDELLGNRYQTNDRIPFNMDFNDFTSERREGLVYKNELRLAHIWKYAQ